MSIAPIASGMSTATLEQAGQVARSAQLKKIGFNPAALRSASPAEQGAAVAGQFEAILVRQLLGKTMTSMLGGSGSGAAGSIYGDMLADTFSQQLTSGPGLGLGRYLAQQLTPRMDQKPAAEGQGPEAPDLKSAEVSRL